MSNKIPGQFSEADLLKLLQDDSIKEKAVTDDSTTPSPVKFLTIFNVLPGKNRIKTTALYKLYKKWAGKTGVSQTMFTMQVRNYLPYSDSNTTFSIEQTALNLSTRFAKEMLAFTPPKRYCNKRLKEHIDKFIAEFDLKRGDVYIDLDEVHEKYWMYCAKTKKTRRIPLPSFLNVMKLYFNHLVDQHGTTKIGFQSYGKKEEEKSKKENS